MSILAWAQAFMTSLIGSATSEPKNAAMWPPHRNGPTRERSKRGKPAQTRMAVVNGRVTIEDASVRLVGGKGLR